MTFEVMEEHGSNPTELCSGIYFMAPRRRGAESWRPLLCLHGISCPEATLQLLTYACLHPLLPISMSVSPPGSWGSHCTLQVLTFMECYVGCLGHSERTEPACSDKAALKSAPASNQTGQDHFSVSNIPLNVAQRAHSYSVGPEAAK